VKVLLDLVQLVQLVMVQQDLVQLVMVQLV
jgi:hypothetical protein